MQRTMVRKEKSDSELLSGQAHWKAESKYFQHYKEWLVTLTKNVCCSEIYAKVFLCAPVCSRSLPSTVLIWQFVLAVDLHWPAAPGSQPCHWCWEGLQWLVWWELLREQGLSCPEIWVMGQGLASLLEDLGFPSVLLTTINIWESSWKTIPMG